MAILSKFYDANGSGLLQQPRTRKLLVLLLSGYAAYKFSQRNVKKTQREDRGAGAAAAGKHAKSQQGAVDGKFFTRLGRLIEIVVPTPMCKEAIYLMILLGFLVARTFLSIKISEVNGSIVKAIVDRQFSTFLTRLAVLASIAIPASTVNSMLKFLGNKLALGFRVRLVNHFQTKYLAPMMYYKVLNIDSRINNPDQALTETIDKWSKSLAELYSNVTKPLLDIILFSRKLSELVGVQGPLSVILYYFISGVIIRLISPRFGKLTAEAQRLEGEFRFCHNRIITHAEEIAFYGGHNREKTIITDKFYAIVRHLNNMFVKYFWMGIFDGFLVKYGAVMVGYAVLGLPVFGPGSEEYIKQVEADPSRITSDYIRNSSLLINLARAIGRIVTSYKVLQQLAGYTSLVTQLQDVLEDLEQGNYERKMVEGDSKLPSQYRPGAGTLINDSATIKFDKVPIVTPNGDLLAGEMTFEVLPGMNLMIIGPNGCGKSSLFRILGELWPIFGGKLSKPKVEDLFYIPQKPYLAVGTLRDQVIYPHTVEQARARGYDDEKLASLLKQVHLGYVVERESAGWDARQDWQDVLSGGEKQRVAMARLFYHKPRFAILDECTSAVSVDVEGFMYTHCRELGISLITVSHRPSLWKYHDYKLKFDGRGSWEFGKMEIEQDFKPVA